MERTGGELFSQIGEGRIDHDAIFAIAMKIEEISKDIENMASCSGSGSVGRRVGTRVGTPPL